MSARGNVYILQTGPYYKIGKSIRDPQERLHTLQTGSPFPMRLVDHYEVDDCYAAEQALHARYSPYCNHGEWFLLDDRQLQDIRMSLALDEIHLQCQKL